MNLKDLPDTGPRLKFLLRFKAALYVTPPKAKDDIKVAGFTPDPEGLALDLENGGSAHALIREPAVKLTLADGKTMLVSGPGAHALNDINVHAGAQRRVVLPLLPSVAASVRGVNLEYLSGF